MRTSAAFRTRCERKPARPTASDRRSKQKGRRRPFARDRGARFDDEVFKLFMNSYFLKLMLNKFRKRCEARGESQIARERPRASRERATEA